MCIQSTNPANYCRRDSSLSTEAIKVLLWSVLSPKNSQYCSSLSKTWLWNLNFFVFWPSPLFSPSFPSSSTVQNFKSPYCGVHIVLTDRQPSPVHNVCEPTRLATGMASFSDHDSSCWFFHSCNYYYHNLLLDGHHNPYSPSGTQVKSPSICSTQYNSQCGRCHCLRLLPNKSFRRKSRLSRSLCTGKRKYLLLGGLREFQWAGWTTHRTGEYNKFEMQNKVLLETTPLIYSM